IAGRTSQLRRPPTVIVDAWSARQADLTRTILLRVHARYIAGLPEVNHHVHRTGKAALTGTPASDCSCCDPLWFSAQRLARRHIQLAATPAGEITERICRLGEQPSPMSARMSRYGPVAADTT